VSVRRTKRFWAVSLDLKLFLDILNFFVKMHLTNKLRESTKIVFFGPMDQKLWVFEAFRRSLGRAGANEEKLTTCGKI
jgi:hypothetical protein